MTDRAHRAVTSDELLAQVGWLRDLARRLARDAASADDLTQGVLVRALEAPPAGGRALRPWLASVVRSLARRDGRSESRRSAREWKAARADSEPPADSYLEQFEEQRRLADLVSRLEEPYRTVVIRRYFAGETAARIAEESGVPAASVRAQLARALAQLREMHTRAHGSRDRSFAALGLAGGLTFPSTAPLATAPTGIASILAMKTATKVAAAAALPLLLMAAWFVVRGLDAAPGRSPAAEASPLVEVTDVASRDVAAPDPAEAPEVQRDRVVAEAAAPSPEPQVVEAVRTMVALRAVDAAGVPIAGAVVEVSKRNGEPDVFAPSEPSGADGRLELHLPDKARFRTFGAQEWQTLLRLRADGFATQFLHETLVDAQRTELGDRALALGAGMSGRVLTASWSPVAGVEIVAMPGGPAQPNTGWDTSVIFKRSGPHDDESYSRARTDELGQFVFEGLPAQPLHVWFRDGDLPWNVSDTFELSAGEHRGGVELVLPELGREDQILGRVVRPDGAPAVGARVRTRLGPFWDPEGVAVAEDGSFAIVPEDDGAVDLMAYDPEGAFSPSHRTPARRGGDEVVLALAPQRIVEVLVLDPDGAPVANAWMQPLLDHSPDGSPSRRADDEGRCSLLVPDEAFHLHVGASDYVMRELGPFDPGALPPELVVELERDRAVHGIVRAEGEPVPGADVYLMRDMHELFIVIFKGFPEGYQLNGAPVKTGADGRFRMTIDAIGAESWALLVEKDGYARTELVLPPEADDRDDPIEIALTSGGALEGRVLVGPSRGSEGVVIACSRFDGRPLVVRTDEDGFYRLEHLTPGPWRVEDRRHTPRGDIMSMTSRGEREFEPNVTIAEGVTTVLDFDLRWQEGLTLDGRLRFDGVPARTWSARVQEGEGQFEALDLAPAELDEEGRFRAPAEPGPVKLVLEAAAEGEVVHKMEHDIVIDAATEPIEWDLATGSVRGAGEAAGARLRIKGELAGGARHMVLFRADESGRFEIDGVPAGDASLMRYEDGVHGLGWYRSTPVSVAAGEITAIE